MNEQLQAEIQASEDVLSQLTPNTEQWMTEKRKLDGLKKKQAALIAAEVVEEKVHTEITFSITGVDLTNLPVELINIIEKVVKADRRRIYNETAVEMDQLEAERDEIKNMYESDKVNYDILQEDYNTCERELKEQTEETIRILAERDEARKNRDNANAQLEEAKAEISRLKSEIDDYQKAKVFGEKESQSIIDVNADEAEAINAAIKQFVESEDWGSRIKVVKQDGSFELIKRDEYENEWSQIESPTLGEEAEGQSTFQEVAPAVTEDGGVSAPEVTFQGQEPTVPTDSTNGEMANAPVTRSEFEALKARVDAIESDSKGVAA